MTEQHSPETSPESVLLSQDPDGSADEALDAVLGEGRKQSVDIG